MRRFKASIICANSRVELGGVDEDEDDDEASWPSSLNSSVLFGNPSASGRGSGPLVVACAELGLIGPGDDESTVCRIATAASCVAEEPESSPPTTWLSLKTTEAEEELDGAKLVTGVVAAVGARAG
jgi:hypothetical protein